MRWGRGQRTLFNICDEPQWKQDGSKVKTQTLGGKHRHGTEFWVSIVSNRLRNRSAVLIPMNCKKSKWTYINAWVNFTTIIHDWPSSLVLFKQWQRHLSYCHHRREKCIAWSLSWWWYSHAARRWQCTSPGWLERPPGWWHFWRHLKHRKKAHEEITKYNHCVGKVSPLRKTKLWFMWIIFFL